jgi:hypothetical protein
MNEATAVEEPTQQRLVPILLVIATMAVTSWACATTLERLELGGGAFVGSSSSILLNAPADRLDRP